MDNGRFHAILPLIVAALTDMIATEYLLDENTAIERLYATQLYSYLENEKLSYGIIAHISSLTYLSRN